MEQWPKVSLLTKLPRQLNNNEKDWLRLVGIVLLAISLRLFQLGKENLWTDEWLSLGDAGHISDFNRHRPLFYLVLHYWTRILSITHLAAGDGLLRLPAVVCGILEVVLLFLVGRRLVGRAAALVACLIMSMAVPELDHSQEVRMYSMASAFSLASLLALISWVKNGQARVLICGILLTCLAFLTTPTVIFGLLLAGGIAVAVLLYRGESTAALWTLIGYSLSFAAWWPLHRYARMAVSFGSLSWIPRPATGALLWVHGDFLRGGIGAIPGADSLSSLQIAASVFTVALLIVAVVAASYQRSWRVTLLAAWFYAIIIGAYAISIFGQPVWILRYFIYAAPALYLLLGFGLVSLWRWSRAAGSALGAICLGLLIVGAADYYRLPMHENWRLSAATVAEEAGPNDVVAVAGLSGLFRRYFKQYAGRARVTQIIPRISDASQQEEVLLADLLNQIEPHAGRTWIVIREDPRFDRVQYIARLGRYLEKRGMNARIRVFRSVQGQIDVVSFPNSIESKYPFSFAPASSHFLPMNGFSRIRRLCALRYLQFAGRNGSSTAHYYRAQGLVCF